MRPGGPHESGNAELLAAAWSCVSVSPIGYLARVSSSHEHSSPSPDDARVVVEIDQACFRCGYNLRGLPIHGNCPECGRAVDLSMRGFLLKWASTAYIKTIDLGITIVLCAIVLYAILLMTLLGLAAFSPASAIPSYIQGALIAPSALLVYGYWLYTTQDPGFKGAEKAASARAIARAAAIAQLGAKGAAAGLMLAELAAEKAANAGSGNGASPALIAARQAVSIAEIGAWAVAFFAIILYTRWLARRVPDYDLVRTTRRNIWLLPVLQTVGALACGIGPLVAMFLYMSMFQEVQARTREILDWHRRGSVGSV